jgi:hypothetical protein
MGLGLADPRGKLGLGARSWAMGTVDKEMRPLALRRALLDSVFLCPIPISPEEAPAPNPPPLMFWTKFYIYVNTLSPYQLQL